MDLVSVVAITDEHRTPKAREGRLYQRARQAKEALAAEMERYEDPAALKRLLCAYWEAERKQTGYWERRALKAEDGLRRALGTDLSDAERAQVLATLHAERRDPRLLTDHEHVFIQHYRATDGTGKQMIRTLFARLAAAPEVP